MGLQGVHKIFLKQRELVDFGSGSLRVRIEHLSLARLNSLLSSLPQTSSGMTNERTDLLRLNFLN